MAEPKQKLTATQRAAKKKRRKEHLRIFVNGKEKRVKREPTIDGLEVDELIQQNADPIWLLQNGMWEHLHSVEDKGVPAPDPGESDEIPF